GFPQHTRCHLNYINQLVAPNFVNVLLRHEGPCRILRCVHVVLRWGGRSASKGLPLARNAASIKKRSDTALRTPLDRARFILASLTSLTPQHPECKIASLASRRGQVYPQHGVRLQEASNHESASINRFDPNS